MVRFQRGTAWLEGKFTAPAPRMMSPLIHDVPRLRRINLLLQQGLALPQAEREIWLKRIANEQGDLMPILRALLTRATTESDAFMARPVDSVWTEAIDLSIASFVQVRSPLALLPCRSQNSP